MNAGERKDSPRGAAARGERPTPSELRVYEELQCYTLARGDADFVHQHVVDAWAAQHADTGTKPIAITFALIGLYLRVEKGFTGRQVQRVHMMLGRRRPPRLSLTLPPGRGSLTASHVMSAAPGPERDRAIDAWCASVWEAYHDCREAVVALLVDREIV